MVPDSDKDSCSNANTPHIGDVAQGFREEIKYYHLELREQIKSSLQAVADSQRRYWSGVESRLILWVAIIAVILAASGGLLGLTDGLVVGAVVVGLAVAGRVYLRGSFVRKQMNRVDSFRERFRDLLDTVNVGIVAEDKAFLEEYKDRVLFPGTVSGAGNNGTPSGRNLAHVEILYLEYCSLRHLHPWPDPNDPNSNTELNCGLCMAADRVRKNIEGAISAYEAAIASARHKLAAQIDDADPDGALDAKSFLDEYSKRRPVYYVPEDLALQDEKLLGWLNSLCARQHWTFEDADKLRALCRFRAKETKSYDEKDRFEHLGSKLTQEMKSAAARCGLQDTWDWYDSASNRLAASDGTIARIRRIVGRHSAVAMFLELKEQFEEPFLGIADQLPGITKWGYDPKLVAKERRIAAKLIAKDRDKYDRERERELRAMEACIRAERE